MDNLYNILEKIRIKNEKIIVEKIDKPEYSFFKINEIVYEKEKTNKENMENVFSAIKNIDMSFVYLMVGKREKIDIYMGISKEKNLSFSENLASDYCLNHLKPVFLGNYLGSKVSEIKKAEIEDDILYPLKKAKYISIMRGIPNIREIDEKDTQNLDYLINTMFGKEFQIIIHAVPCNIQEIIEMEDKVRQEYEKICEENSLKIQIQDQKSASNVSNIGKSFSKSKNNSDIKEQRTRKEEREGGTYSSSSKSDSWSKTENKSETEENNRSENESKNESNSKSITYEKINKKYTGLIEYIDNTLFKRINLGKNKGMFKVSVILSTNTVIDQGKLEGTIGSLFNGEDLNFNPIYFENIKVSKDEKESLLTQFHSLKREEVFEDEKGKYFLLSRVVEKNMLKASSYMTAKELSLLAGVPQKETAGIPVREGIDFGINVPLVKAENKIILGKIMQRGKTLSNSVFLDKNELNKHIFIAGVTGSGKTTTCQKLLIESEMPFLVIEPAKTEYRELLDSHKNLKIFTLGNETISPFRINPFEFLPSENITSHVDMLKASFEAAFDMDAAIPQLIEVSIYRCYEEYGWDIEDNSNIYLKNKNLAWETGGIYFPTLADLLRVVDSVVREKGMGERLQGEYIGSIKARLEGLIVGSKGQMLNTRVSFDFNKLLDEKVVFELEEIKSGQDKALIMGFILTRLCETLKSKWKKNNDYKHITLIEEAHRLLAKAYPGEMSKKQAVEIFADMLAEIRKYGESLIIVDQIPEKLSTEVLKNTNTKIIHKLFSRDDKNAVGDTMSMDERQKEYLSNLNVGEGIVFSQGWQKSVQVKIEILDELEAKNFVNKEEKQKLIENKEKKIYELGKKLKNENMKIFYPGLNFIENKDNLNELFVKYKEFMKELKKIIKKNSKVIKNFKELYKRYSLEEKEFFITLGIIKNDSRIILEEPKVMLEKKIDKIIKDLDNIDNPNYKNTGTETTEEKLKKYIIEIM